MVVINQNEFSAIVDDFEVFCNFLNEKKPVLSKKSVALGKKDLYDLNCLLAHGKKVAAPNYQQESYFFIDLVFNLALLGQLYIRSSDEKDNVRLVRTIRKDEYDTLNVYEKYAFLLETFWTRYDMSKIERANFGGIRLNSLHVGDFTGRSDFDSIFSYSSKLIHLVSFFGLCTIVPGVEKYKKTNLYEDLIETVIPTKLGVRLYIEKNRTFG